MPTFLHSDNIYLRWKNGSQGIDGRAILIINTRQGYVRNIDISRQLEFSKPSVTIALKKLRDENLIYISADNLITLTERGLEIAKETYTRHLSITKILTYLGVSEETAEKDACRIEHVISQETFNAIAEHAQKMLTKV